MKSLKTKKFGVYSSMAWQYRKEVEATEFCKERFGIVLFLLSSEPKP